FHMKDGTVRFNPGRNNPEVVRPAGPIDPAVNILLFADQATGKSMASVANFALHLDTLGGSEYSADYPFYLQKMLQAAIGHPFVSIFATGTCGDINHIDIHNNNPLKGIAETERIGTTLGDTIFAAIPKLEEQKQLSLAVRQKTIDVPAQHFSPDETAKAKERM